MAYLSIKDRAQLVREELKAAGIKQSKVSVKVQHYSSINLQLRVEAEELDMDVVRAAAYKHESIDRCEVSGEILSGGNTFVFIRSLQGYLL